MIVVHVSAPHSKGWRNTNRALGESIYDYYKVIGQREKMAISTVTSLPKQTVMVYGPGLYQPSTTEKLSAVDSYLSIFDALLPIDDSITAPRFWHNDLQAGNIFVDHNDHSKIVGIIDWQGNDLLPLYHRLGRVSSSLIIRQCFLRLIPLRPTCRLLLVDSNPLLWLVGAGSLAGLIEMELEWNL